MGLEIIRLSKFFKDKKTAGTLQTFNDICYHVADGMMTKLLVNEPYAAGKASVMVAVNDIYSMGGRPLAMVNVTGRRG